MMMERYPNAKWFTSTQSGANGNCVEVAFVDAETIAVRDSKDRGGAVLTFNPQEWDAFVRGATEGQFNRPA